jgi:propionate CoA-transferase
MKEKVITVAKKPVMTASEAVLLVKDGDTVSISGFVASCMPEALSKALEERFLDTGSPKGLTLLYTVQGNRDGSGGDHFAHDGMLRRVIGGHWNLVPNLGKMAIGNKIEAYNLPQGVIAQLFRDVASHKVGTITHVGLNTFADPRIEGGKLNSITKEDIVEVVNIGGQERLFYKAFPVNIGILRGTYADENGNITLEREACSLDVTSIAQAVKNSGGKVIVQVERVVAVGTLDPKLVKIPGIYVDAIVIAQDKGDHVQCVGSEYDGSMSGEIRTPLGSLDYPPLSMKKIIGRRAAMELTENAIVNLGIGIPEFISMVASEEGVGDYMTLTLESGPVGGVPQGGSKFGGSLNPDAILDQAYQFDFYDGGGVDLAFLGLAQADKDGNINVSKFGPRIAGCGGFINISQNAKKVFFCGTFTADGLKTTISDGKLVVTQEGKERKFIDKVEQITFSGAYANKIGQPVMFITERAVFELRTDGVYLTEVAPGIDARAQVIELMGFVPKIDGEPKLMDSRIFSNALMGLKKN